MSDKPQSYIVTGHWDGHGNDYYTINQKDDKTVDEIALTARKVAHALNAHAELIASLNMCRLWFERHSPTAELINGKSAEHPMLTVIKATLAQAQVQP